MTAQILLHTEDQFDLSALLEVVDDGILTLNVLDESPGSFSLAIEYDDVEDLFDLCGAIVRVLMEQNVSEFKFSIR